MNIEFGIVIVAGGTSARYGEKNKLLEEIGGISIVVHSMINFRHICPDNQIVLVCHSNFIETYKDLISKYIPSNSFSYAEGGETRGDSVYKGLQTLNQRQVQYASIHDAARPLASSELMIRCFKQCMKNGSAVAAKKITDTIKSADSNNRVISTIDRTKLWSIETPQTFKLSDILNAYSFVKSKGMAVTDDAGAMESFGKEVFIFENTEYNQKITYTWDLPIANFIYEKLRSER